MPLNPNLLKKLLITVFIIIGLFTGYQLLSQTDEESSSETEVREQGYVEEDVQEFEESIKTDGQDAQKIQFNNSFEHTNPGVSSEIIVNAEGFEPGEFTIVYVRFAGTEEYIEAGGQEHTADSDGKISTRFTITQFGDYEVLLSSRGESITSPTISVE